MKSAFVFDELASAPAWKKSALMLALCGVRCLLIALVLAVILTLTFPYSNSYAAGGDYPYSYPSIEPEAGAYLGEYDNSSKARDEFSGGLELFDRGAVEDFYLRRQGKSFWLKRNRLNKNGAELIKAIRLSWTHGLNPLSYNWRQIEAVIGSSRDIKRGMKIHLDRDKISTFEIMLTDAYVRYVRDLSGMRVEPAAIALSTDQWRQRVSAQAALSALSEIGNGDIRHLLDQVTPQGETYKALQVELKRLLASLEDGSSDDLLAPIRISGLLMPGNSNRQVPNIRRRLGVVNPENGEGLYKYDKELVSAVMGFQQRNGLRADGIIGEKTLYILNQSKKDKVLQIIANLERLRWVYEENTRKKIIVNIPSAMLWGIENGKVVFEMPVVVGRPKRQTPLFRANIVGVRLNPDWTVPPTIKKEDILPRLVEDPAYLIDKGIELYDGYGKGAQTLDPSSIDWASVTDRDLHAFRMVQIPGVHNPLGLIRVLMPNRHNIYLHDTNHKDLFAKESRAKSSGCIRLKYPRIVADFILSERKDWYKDYVSDRLKDHKTKDIMINSKIPVYTLYYTVWLGDDGRVIYGQDIYSRDRKLLRLLENIDGIPFLSYNYRLVADAAK